jgi:hypothetical protein
LQMRLFKIVQKHLVLFNKETSKHVWLIDDLGYQHSVDGKEHLVLAQYRREVL